MLRNNYYIFPLVSFDNPAIGRSPSAGSIRTGREPVHIVIETKHSFGCLLLSTFEIAKNQSFLPQPTLVFKRPRVYRRPRRKRTINQMLSLLFLVWFSLLPQRTIPSVITLTKQPKNIMLRRLRNKRKIVYKR